MSLNLSFATVGKGLLDLFEEVRVARAAVRDYEALIHQGLPADKAVDDVFIAHYAVRELYVPDVEPRPVRQVWPSLSRPQIGGALPTAA